MPKRDKLPETVEELVRDGIDELKARKHLIKRMEITEDKINKKQAELKEIQKELSELQCYGLNASQLLANEIEKRAVAELDDDAD